MAGPVRLLAVLLACGATLSALPSPAVATAGERFQRVDTMSVFRNSSVGEHTAAEIAAATPDGRTVVYTDSPAGRIGFAKVGQDGKLGPDGVLGMPGEPTSVDIVGRLALVAVNTSQSFVAPSGVLVVVDLGTRAVAVTLQENNHIAIVDLRSGRVLNHFTAGSATVRGVDTSDDGKIDPSDTIRSVREPDAVAWLDDRTLGTADEGDYLGGSRTWTVFDAATGRVVYSSGNELEQAAIRQGQYPDGRSDNKGVEPEGLAVATFGRHRYAFVGMERANLVAVYDVNDPRRPRFLQALPTGVGPEGLLPIPATGTLVVSAEEDVAEDSVRSSLSSYRLPRTPLSAALAHNQGAPSIVSDGIGFGALSGLSGIPGDGRNVVSVTDAAYSPTRVLTIDTLSAPARARKELTLTKDGQPVGYDGEGIAARRGGGYWVAAEGDGKSLPNLLVEVTASGAVVREVPLPATVAATATSNGFEGVTVTGRGGREQVWVAVQREWKADAPGQVTLARFTPATGEWGFVAYPLDTAPAGAWIGLSEVTALDDRTLLVLERDNQRGTAATTKKVYRVDITDTSPAAAGEPKPLVAKTLAYDLLPALTAGGGAAHDKPEGLAVVGDGRLRRLVGAVDNDGVEDAPGETVFLRLGRVH